MIISHNLMAMNAQNQFGINNNAKAKSTEKLSSGYRINRSADDAAGLAISEKMRRQIRGLTQGSHNIQDGISLLQVADGAMSEIDDMLHRITELNIKALNETNTAEERQFMDDEVQHLKAEIDKIDSLTTFNTKPVFFEAGEVIPGTTPTAKSRFFQILDGNISTTGYMQEQIPADYLSNLNYTNAHSIKNGNPFVGVHINFDSIVKKDISELADTNFYVNCCTDCCPSVVTFLDDSGINVSSATPSPAVRQSINIGLKKADGNYYDDAAEFTKDIVDSLKSQLNSSSHVEFANDGAQLLIYDVDPNKWSEAAKQKAYFCDTSNFYNPGTMVTGGLWIQMGAEAEQGMYISTGRVSTTHLGIGEIHLDPIEEAEKALSQTKSALTTASRIRSHIGSQQNRLEHSYNINNNTVENTTSAESKIRDTDMSKEMVQLSIKNILEQSGMTMISQANQSNQGVLSLLQ